MNTVSQKDTGVKPELTEAQKKALETSQLVAYERAGNPRWAWVRAGDGQYYRASATEAENLLTERAPHLAGLREACLVDIVHDRLMCPAGIRTIDGQRVLIVRHARAITPARCTLDCSSTWTAIRQDYLGAILLRALDDAQLRRLCVLIANAFQRIREWQHGEVVTLSPALCLLGAQGAGKTLILSVLAKLLGGASDISPYMRGDSAFLPNVMATPLLLADDAREELSTYQRRTVMTAIKAFMASSGVAINRKNREPITMHLPWQIGIAGNSAQALPLCDAGDAHKILALWLPEPLDLTDGQAEMLHAYIANNECLARFAGYCVRLADTLPADSDALAASRQICAGWTSPDIVQALQEISPAESVGDAIMAAVQDWPETDWGSLTSGVSMRALRLRATRAADVQTRRRLPATESGFKALAIEWLERQGVTATKDDKGNVVYCLQTIWQSIQTH